MKTRLIITSILILFSLTIIAQECEFYYPKLEGTKLEYQQYDKKGKPSGKLVQELVKFESTPTGSEGEFISKSYDDKDELLHEATLSMRCEEGVFYFDMKSYLNPESMESYQDMDVKVDASDAEFPSDLKVGDQLKDASVTVTVTAGVVPMTMVVTITDRKVEAKENITTPAGTFETYKLTQTNTINFGFKTVMQSEEWYSKEVGMVRSITYRKGKEFSRSELISITH
jgi:hypothetical protein